MKIHCTRGCICDCLTIDDVDLSDITTEQKLLLLEHVRDYILKNGFKEDYLFESFLQEVLCIDEEYAVGKYEIMEDEETCEFNINNTPIKNLSSKKKLLITKELLQHIIDTYTEKEICWFMWWFMTDYIGLSYQYHCDECGDSVYSETINI